MTKIGPDFENIPKRSKMGLKHKITDVTQHVKNGRNRARG